MEIPGPLNNLRINDNPDTYNIQDEMDAINEPTPGWVKDMDMIKVGDFLVARDSEVGCETVKLRKRITTLEKRWKALRKEVSQIICDEEVVYVDYIQTLMTEITRKIK